MKPKFLLLFITSFLIFISCNKKENKTENTVLKGLVFGTTYKIYYKDVKDHKKAIDSLFAKVNQSVSTYIPNSDISRINRGDTTVVVDAIFKEVFLKSKKIHKTTNGFFDPTVGNLVNAYGFGPKQEQKNLTLEEVENYMKLVGFDKVILKNNKIVKEHPNIYLDFNSIAKGFGIDVIARYFDKKNIENYLIEIGGEIRAKGLKAKNMPWTIKLVNPVKVGSETGFTKLNLSNKSMATSGNYRKFRIANDGKKYVHTVNPKTGLAEESNLLSVSVISNLDCADVDAYATAFMAMGLSKTKEFLLKNSEIEVILIYFSKEKELKEFSTYTYN